MASAGFEKDEVVIPAEILAAIGLGEQFEQVGAAAEDDVLRVDGFGEGGMRVGVDAAANFGAALEDGDSGTVPREGYSGGEAGETAAYDEDVVPGERGTQRRFLTA